MLVITIQYKIDVFGLGQSALTSLQYKVLKKRFDKKELIKENVYF